MFRYKKDAVSSFEAFSFVSELPMCLQIVVSDMVKILCCVRDTEFIYKMSLCANRMPRDILPRILQTNRQKKTGEPL